MAYGRGIKCDCSFAGPLFFRAAQTSPPSVGGFFAASGGEAYSFDSILFQCRRGLAYGVCGRPWGERWRCVEYSVAVNLYSWGIGVNEVENDFILPVLK